MTFKIVSACLLVHTQPRKGFSGPSEKGEQKKKKKEKTGKEKKIVIHSEGFLKEQFADTQV